MRVKRGTTTRKRHKKLLKTTKGYRHGRKSLVRMAHQASLKAGKYAYRDRKNKKRTFRGLWIIKINAACKQLGITYSVFMNKLQKNKIELDRKILADLAENNFEEFKKIVEKVRK